MVRPSARYHPKLIRNTQPVIFLKLDFGDAGTSYVNTSNKTIIWNGWKWLGLGAFCFISEIEEGTENKSYGFTFGLQGFTASEYGIEQNEWLDYLLNLKVKNRPVFIWIGLLDDDFNLIQDFEPELIARGVMDNKTLETGDEVKISITCENRLVKWQQYNPSYYTDQQTRYPQDLGCVYIPGLETKEI